MNPQFPGTQAVIEAFAWCETETAFTIVTRLNVRFAKAMGVKLEDSDTEDHAIQDGMTMTVSTDPYVGGRSGDGAGSVPDSAHKPY
ncbi:hypothetical protein [Hoeflea alexandrii]